MTGSGLTSDRSANIWTFIAHLPQKNGNRTTFGRQNGLWQWREMPACTQLHRCSAALSLVKTQSSQRAPSCGIRSCGPVHKLLLEVNCKIVLSARGRRRSEERRVGKECRSGGSPYH